MQLRRADDDCAMRIAEDDLRSHADQLVDEEETRLEHLLVDDDDPFALCRGDEGDRHRIRREGRPGLILELRHGASEVAPDHHLLLAGDDEILSLDATDDAETLEAERDANGPFRDVGDLARRAQVSREALEALVRGGACDGFGPRRRDLLWELGLATRPRSVAGTRGEAKQLSLPLDPTAETPALPDLTRWERMLADYRETGLSVGTHPLALLRPHLPPGTLSSPDLHEARHGSTVAFAGMAIARQRPATAKGIVFMLLEDEHGQVNLIVPKDVYERHRGIVRGEPIVLVRGRYERVERNRNVLVRELESLSALARRVAATPDVVAALPRAHHFGHR